MTTAAQEPTQTEQEEAIDLAASPRERKLPVVEIFGPTIQGEGAIQGVPCNFIRLGGCDYRCEWCDTPHAVLPDLVRKFAAKLTAQEIVAEVLRLPRGPQWIVISGGNPALFDLDPLVTLLLERQYKVAVETQGSRWKDWLNKINSLAVSPKPPSSGHRVAIKDIQQFMDRLSMFKAFLKVVVFDQADYAFAREVHLACPDFAFFLSTGNDAGATVGDPSRKDVRSYLQVVGDLVNKGRWLANTVMIDPVMADVQVQLQQHVLYWGNERGK